MDLARHAWSDTACEAAEMEADAEREEAYENALDWYGIVPRKPHEGERECPECGGAGLVHDGDWAPCGCDGGCVKEEAA